MNNLYLAHHGILGQKWGVRRYQNFDGSYTKKGLERYGKSRAKYEESKKAYKSAKESGDDLAKQRAKNQLKTDRAKMNKDYKHPKQDKLADQGKQLYSEGHTITGGNFNLTYKVGAVALATAVTKVALSKTSLASTTLVNRFGKFNMADIAAAGVGVAGAAVNIGMRAKQYDRDKKLRAYYGHTSKY